MILNKVFTVFVHNAAAGPNRAAVGLYGMLHPDRVGPEIPERSVNHYQYSLSATTAVCDISQYTGYCRNTGIDMQSLRYTGMSKCRNAISDGPT
jgi:hypothetical protein